MTRKDYIAIAGALKWAHMNETDEEMLEAEGPVMAVAARLADRMQDDNPRFDREHFLAVVRGEKDLNSRPARKPVDEWDSHRGTLGYCAKCGGQCYFDSEGKRVIANQSS